MSRSHPVLWRRPPFGGAPALYQCEKGAPPTGGRKKYTESSYLGTVKIISPWSGAWGPRRTLAIDKVVPQHAVAQSDHFLKALPALDYLLDRIWGLHLAHSLPARGLWVLQVGKPRGGGCGAFRAMVIDFFTIGCHRFGCEKKKNDTKPW